jgi:DNA-binding MarR family transcriptional regulator
MSQFDDISVPIESRIAIGFARIGTAMRGQAWERAVAQGVTPTQADILALLDARGSALRLSLVAEQLAISAATTSDAVSTLVSKGLVEKARAADDGRAIALSLTTAGAAMAAEVAGWSGFLATAAATLDATDQAGLLRLLIKLIRAMQERGDIAAARMCVTCKYFEPHRYKNPSLPHYCHFVKAPFGDRHLRLDCAEHDAADSATMQRNWAAYSGT